MISLGAVPAAGSLRGRNMPSRSPEVSWVQSISALFCLSPQCWGRILCWQESERTEIKAAEPLGLSWSCFLLQHLWGLWGTLPRVWAHCPLGGEVSLLPCQAPETTITLTSPLFPWSLVRNLVLAHAPAWDKFCHHDFRGPFLCSKISLQVSLIVTYLSPKIVSYIQCFALYKHCLEPLTHPYKSGNTEN